MPDPKPFRIVIAVPFEAIVYGTSREEVLANIEEGDEDGLNEILENGLPMVAELSEAFDTDTTVVEDATPESMERILGEADPDIEGALTDEPDPGPLNDEGEEEEEDEDGE